MPSSGGPAPRRTWPRWAVNDPRYTREGTLLNIDKTAYEAWLESWSARAREQVPDGGSGSAAFGDTSEHDDR